MPRGNGETKTKMRIAVRGVRDMGELLQKTAGLLTSKTIVNLLRLEVLLLKIRIRGSEADRL
jgi:hypothetical protein